jgi:hypothetical protein
MKKQTLSKKTNPAVVAGVAWYREADWPRVKQLFPDANEMHDTHAEWLKSADKLVKRLRREGVTAEPCVLDIDDFLRWCVVEGRPRDAEARSDYVAHQLRLKYQRHESGKQ